ncbi:uncharacterized protein MYCFIDRAFT_172121 [Pseudocercospora fijiensis CIRAD86]|uniref:Uncharacterized protein n=1 Tax=Pseudocercospora fijiensis (strain CIRAD86) TaxID=383855 RepID=M3BAU3_PSEFD|nr:uncharacterized protein MYCFIDRAFT_172121 [Pseudocercospora fijiensis CIRAD86]EME86348.1 hypothetical protein MYCFIDRAFT_172121 [Pseudocercospora fijiensis CIRAD86]
MLAWSQQDSGSVWTVPRRQPQWTARQPPKLRERESETPEHLTSSHRESWSAVFLQVSEIPEAVDGDVKQRSVISVGTIGILMEPS